MDRWWDRVHQQRVREKDVNFLYLDVEAMYDRLDDRERDLADQVFCEWVELDDTTKQHIALFAISEHRTRSALPYLRAAAERFENAEGPSAPYDWARVNRIIGRITEGQRGPGQSPLLGVGPDRDPGGVDPEERQRQRVELDWHLAQYSDLRPTASHQNGLESRSTGGGVGWVVRTSGLILVVFVGVGALIAGGVEIANSRLDGPPWAIGGLLALGFVGWAMARRYRRGTL